MKPNEFILIRDNIQITCNAIAVLYSEEKNRGFVVYDDGTINNNNNKKLLKIGEIINENDEIIVEDITDEKEINDVWEQFKKLYIENLRG